jgi:uncharacterized membrane protein YdjX (TVP38/TMEM64 family)
MNRWISITALALLAVGIAILIAIGPPAGGVEHMREVLLDYGPWAVAVSAGLMLGQAVIAPLPANVITITNGLVFGPLWGALLSWSTMLIGSAVCFLLSRTLGKSVAARFVGKHHLDKAERFFTRYGLQAVFIIRIMPLVPFDAVSFGAGLVGVPFVRFTVATAVGTIPSILFYSYVGSVAADAYWWIMIGVLAASLTAVIGASRLVKRQPAPAFLTEP